MHARGGSHRLATCPRFQAITARLRATWMARTRDGPMIRPGLEARRRYSAVNLATEARKTYSSSATHRDSGRRRDHDRVRDHRDASRPARVDEPTGDYSGER